MGAAEVSKLREATGAGILECKKALDEAGGDFEKAKAILQEKGIASAAKKADREIGASLIHAYIHDGRVGVLLQLGAETDFVTRNEDFKTAAQNIALHIAANPKTESLEEVLAQPFIFDEALTVNDYVKSLIGKIGENIQIVRFTRYDA